MALLVCDELMGSGKTSAAITMMNEASGERFMFVTPFLEEVDRIVKKCDRQKFYDPQNIGQGKLSSLNNLLREQKNIATTHALFHTYGPETIDLICQGGYTLVLDEVVDVVEILNVSPGDMEMLIGSGRIGVDQTSRVHWTDSEYEGRFGSLKTTIQTGNVTLFNNAMLLWNFPIDVFMAFRNVVVLTYMFDAQVQKYYFDMHKVEMNKINTTFQNGAYRFINDANGYTHSNVSQKVHVLQDDAMNKIGDKKTALSASWYQRSRKSEPENLLQLKNNLYNVFRNKYRCGADKALWTAFKEYKEPLKGKGYARSFLSCNARSTNAYRERDHLAYCVNIFHNPLLKQYFVTNGIRVREEEYALSEMVQWMWRSAIRDGRDIKIYVPSSRMRGMLESWLLGL